MKDIRSFIESGIIEAYVLGMASTSEIMELEELIITHPEVKRAIDDFSNALEDRARANAIAPDPLIKPLLMATLDFMNRLDKGEKPTSPPNLHANSSITDFGEWLNRPDMVAPTNLADIYAKIIGHTPASTTAIVWIKEMAPQEVHDDEYEKFLIVEGTCTVTIANKPHYLVKGDFLAIPLNVHHSIRVTSNIPCKAILQRVAA